MCEALQKCLSQQHQKRRYDGVTAFKDGVCHVCRVTLSGLALPLSGMLWPLDHLAQCNAKSYSSGVTLTGFARCHAEPLLAAAEETERSGG